MSQPAVAPDASATDGGWRLTGRDFLRKALWFGPGQILPALIGLISTAIFTRIFATEEYGRYALVVSIVGLVAAVLAQWLVQGTTRYLPVVSEGSDARALLRTLSTLITRLAGITVVLGAGLVGILGLFLRDPQWRILLVPAVALTLATTLNLPILAALQSRLQAGYYSAFRLLETALRFGVSLALVLWVVRSPASLLWGGAAGLLVSIPFIWRTAGLTRPRVGGLTPEENRVAKGVVRYGLPMLGWYLASVLLSVSDRYLIQLFRGAGEVGIYSANYTLVFGSVQLISAPIGLAAHPFLMRAWGEGDEARAAQWLTRIVQWFLVGSIFLLAWVLYLAPELARLFLGAGFREGYLVMPLAMAGMVAWQFGMYAHKPLEFNERTRHMLWLGVASAVANILLNIVFVPRYGYIAAAWTTLASYLIYAVAATRAGRRQLRWTVLSSRTVLALTVLVGGAAGALAVRSAMRPDFGWPVSVSGGAAVLSLAGGLAIWVTLRSRRRG